MASRVVFLTPGALSSHDLARWLLRHEDQYVRVGADDIAAVSLHSDGYIELEYEEWLDMADTEEDLYPTADEVADARHFSLESDQIEAPTAFTRCDQVLGARLMMAKTDLQLDYGNQGTRASTGNHYSTMSIADICDMPVRELTADCAHLHLWTTNSFLREAFAVVDAWGFEYKSCAVWCKPQMGIGNYVRVSHELVMIAVKGDCKSFKKKNVMSWFSRPRTKHSAKPDYWRKVVEENSPGPYLELFGREQIPGWTIYGNQISTQQRIS